MNIYPSCGVGSLYDFEHCWIIHCTFWINFGNETLAGVVSGDRNGKVKFSLISFNQSLKNEYINEVFKTNIYCLHPEAK